eukprot:5366248-Pyramimonas_sp.AAC.1
MPGRHIACQYKATVRNQYRRVVSCRDRSYLRLPEAVQSRGPNASAIRRAFAGLAFCRVVE